MVRNTIRLSLVLGAITLAACNSSIGDDQAAPVTQLPAGMHENLSLGVSLNPLTNAVGALPLVGGVVKPLLCLLPDTVGANIGPQGGTITLGGATFSVPANSLGETVRITMLPVLGNTVAVQFYPEGLHFNDNKRPTLTLNTDCIGNPANDYIVYTDNNGKVLEREPTVSRTAHSITAEIPHFSRYAVAW